MLQFQDISFQLVDLPPISATHMEPWLPGLLLNADAAWLVVDLADPACAEHVLATCKQLAERKIILSDRWPGAGPESGATAPSQSEPPASVSPDVEQMPDPFQAHLPTLLVANKSDLDPDPDEIRVLEELTGVRFPAIATSARTRHRLEELGQFLFRAL